MINQEILNYVIIRKLGDGGMGSVYLAQNKSINQYVAVKMLHPQYSNKPLLRERFRNEAIMLSSLNHPNIVKFLNYVENDQGIFLIMEYVDGMTLEDFINKKNGLIVEEKAYPMFRQILDAFNYAHKHNIVHRDIKPSNILLDKNNNVKILDFGIAQILSETNDSAIKGGGTASYMSPEQIHDKPLDGRSDIYSLGVLFHQMLTGHAPYDVSTLSPFDIKQKVLQENLPPMKASYPYIPDELQAIVDKATSKSPDNRYQTCSDLRKDVIRAHNSIKNGGGGGNNGNGRSNKWIAWAGGALALIIAALGILFFLYKTGGGGSGYYADYTEKNGVPEGIGKLSEAERAQLGAAYKIEVENGNVTSVALVDDKDSVVSITDSLLAIVKYPEMKMSYDKEGKIKTKKVYDDKGNLQFTIKYKDEGKSATIDYEANGNSANGIYTSGQKTKNYAMEYDEKTGRLASIRFVNEEGFPKEDSQGISGYDFLYDKDGHTERITYVDNENKPKENKYEFASVEYKYGDKGEFKGSKSFNKGGFESQPVVKEKKESTGSKAKKNRKNKKIR